MSTDVKSFGKFVRRVRRERGMKLRELGAGIGKSAAYICDIEKGRRGQYINPLLLTKLAEVLNVPLSSMFKEANIEVDENSQKYRALLRMAKSKKRAGEIVQKLETCYTLLGDLRTESKGYPTLEQLAEKLMISVRELDTAISFG